MIRDFGNKIARDLYHRGHCRRLPRELWDRALVLLDMMDAIESLEELQRIAFPPSIRLHRLSGARRGEYAIDIHKLSGWRITFSFDRGEFLDVKVEDYHK